jgi:hypothetical protein
MIRPFANEDNPTLVVPLRIRKFAFLVHRLLKPAQHLRSYDTAHVLHLICTKHCSKLCWCWHAAVATGKYGCQLPMSTVSSFTKWSCSWLRSSLALLIQYLLPHWIFYHQPVIHHNKQEMFLHFGIMANMEPNQKIVFAPEVPHQQY